MSPIGSLFDRSGSWWGILLITLLVCVMMLCIVVLTMACWDCFCYCCQMVGCVRLIPDQDEWMSVYQGRTLLEPPAVPSDLSFLNTSSRDSLTRVASRTPSPVNHEGVNATQLPSRSRSPSPYRPRVRSEGASDHRQRTGRSQTSRACGNGGGLRPARARVRSSYDTLSLPPYDALELPTYEQAIRLSDVYIQ